MSGTGADDGDDLDRPCFVRPAGPGPRGRRPARITAARAGLWLFVLVAAAFFLMPLWVMVTTSLKPMAEVREGLIFALPRQPTVQPWIDAWSRACTGLKCEGIGVGFRNSVAILVPSVVLSIAIGAVNGYALSFWRPRGANLLFGALIVGAFMPYQVFLYPLVRISAFLGIYNTLADIVAVHVLIGLPVTTLIFRNFYVSLPIELFKAARVDGAGFWRIFVSLMLPMSTPVVVVAAILQVTGIWNDFLLGSVFASREGWPMTVQLNNLVNSQMGEKAYDVHMAATILTALVPLVVYFVSGRWFVRGIAAGAVKG